MRARLPRISLSAPRSRFPSSRRALSRSPCPPPARPQRSPAVNLGSSVRIMSSDADYAAFLDKANQDTGASAQTQTTKLGTRTVDTEVPASLKSVDEVYVSDADEPFEPVSLKWSKDAVPNADEFAGLIDHKHKTEQIAIKEWDPKGQYAKVLDAVKKAGNGEATVFQAEHGGTRTEYWVVSLDTKNQRVVGLKALAVES